MDAHGKPMQGVSVTFAVTAGTGRLSATTVTTDATGKAETTLTLGRSPGKQTVTATAAEITPSVITFTAIAAGEPLRAAAPALQPSDLEGLTAAEVQYLLTQARQMALTDPAYLRGIAVLEELLARLLPKETTLLPNYPNPFNPETWIPYQLAKSADVTLHIYSVKGELVRTLALGHQVAGMYQTKSRAAYWDGRNLQGELVASGIYFYTLSAGDFTATRKLLIRK